MFVQITGVKRQVMICSCLYLGQMLAGYSGGWTGPVIPKLRDPDQSPFPYSLTETQLSLTATVIYLGGIFGPYIVAMFSNKRGRKPCMIFAGLLSVTAYVVLTTTKNLPMLYISRVMLGLSSGCTCVVNLVYIGEIASPSIRGILLTATGILTTFGLLLIYSVGSHVSYYGTTYIGLGISIAYVICLLWIPESPIFYALQGNHEQITKTLEDLGRSEDINKMIRMKKDLAETSSGKDWKELFIIRSNRKALFIVVTINCLQHCSGLLAVIFFSAAIFQMAGSSIQSDVAMIIVMCFQLSGSCIAPIFIESIGRKRILLISCAICSLSMFALGLYFYLDLIGNPLVDNIKWLPLAALALFFISYDSGFGIVPNTLTAEMFTSNVRSKGSTVTFSTAYIFGFMVTTAFGALLETVGGHVAFWFFSCTCACAFVFSIFFVPETTGKTLTQIQEDLGNVC